MVKIYKVKGCDSFSKYDIERVKKQLADADYFVYNYESGSWDGTGLAVWKKGNKYGYSYLGHCSCDGPVDDLNSIMYNLSDLNKLAVKNDWDWRYGKLVLARVKELNAKL